MFLVAANRMAELLGIEVFRLDGEEGMPQFVLSLGTSVEEGRDRMRALSCHAFQLESLGRFS